METNLTDNREISEMERVIAERFMKSLLAMCEQFNIATELTMQMSDRSEQVAFRKGLGNIFKHIHGDLMLPIIRQYRDLDPDRDTSPRKRD